MLLEGLPALRIVISSNCSTGAVENVPVAVRRMSFRSTELQHTAENISGGDLTRHTQERYVGRGGLIAWPPCYSDLHPMIFFLPVGEREIPCSRNPSQDCRRRCSKNSGSCKHCRL
jgi:hypothetical protein